MTREEKENLLREAVDILIKLDNHLMTSRDNAEFSAWVEDLIDSNRCSVLEDIKAEIQTLRNCSCSNSDGIIDDVEDILDKYKAESKDKE